ncbi:ABC transporter substrate-binding protein (plasmid) [Paracoccus marcusii]|uniref:ABC transporter substrate-binding protein n=1 Tax=Paracoccus marcusii TaxID=59779 RepID=UPI002ED66BAE|nr:ABC transporter substrate-binding protein [Paracoccus marcusii]
MVLSQGGQAIAVSRAIAARLKGQGHGFDFRDPRAARDALARAHPGPLRVGCRSRSRPRPSWCGTGWTGPAGRAAVHPHRAAALMADALAAEEVDAYCVGEPWASRAVERGVGALLLPGSAIWAAPPERAGDDPRLCRRPSRPHGPADAGAVAGGPLAGPARQPRHRGRDPVAPRLAEPAA